MQAIINNLPIATDAWIGNAWKFEQKMKADDNAFFESIKYNYSFCNATT